MLSCLWAHFSGLLKYVEMSEGSAGNLPLSLSPGSQLLCISESDTQMYFTHTIGLLIVPHVMFLLEK